MHRLLSVSYFFVHALHYVIVFVTLQYDLLDVLGSWILWGKELFAVSVMEIPCTITNQGASFLPVICLPSLNKG
jgi:hypothetical protein